MSTLALGLSRANVEVKTFFRQRDSLIFTFALPAVILIILGQIFDHEMAGGFNMSQLFVPGMIAGGIASTTFINLGIGVATDRDDGTLKRLQGTPMPPMAYLLGKILLVLVATVAEVVLLLLVGVFMFDVTLPSDVDRWLTFAWVFALGVTACSLLGIAAGNLVRTARSAPAVLNLPFIVLQFISGVYVIPVNELPDKLVQIGSLFPLKWMAQGFRSVFMPDQLASYELAGTWEHGKTALVLGAWCVGGLVLCLLTFRWRKGR